MIILKRYLLPYLLSPPILKLGSLRRRMGLYAGIRVWCHGWLQLHTEKTASLHFASDSDSLLQT